LGILRALIAAICLGACAAPEAVDRDGDGVRAGRDCDDRNSSISPDATEIPYDGLDNDCRGGDLIDVDGDGFAGVARELYSGEWPAQLPDVLDCVDDPAVQADAARIFPGAVDVAYDGVDQDCGADEDYDADGDGHLPARLPDGRDTRTARDSYIADWAPGLGGAPFDDCDDSDERVYAGAPDAPYDASDSDCAGDDDYDADGDGWLPDPELWSEARAAWIAAEWDGNAPFDTRWGDCRDLAVDGVDPAMVYPGSLDEPYDGIDHDCDAGQDYDADRDGFVRAGDEAAAATFDRDWEGDGQWAPGDCDDDDPTISPDALEVLWDGIDSDCDGRDGVPALVLDAVPWSGIGGVAVVTTSERVVVAATAEERAGAGPSLQLLTLEPGASLSAVQVGTLAGESGSPVALLADADALDVVHTFTDAATVLRVSHLDWLGDAWQISAEEDAFFGLETFAVSDIDATRAIDGTVTAWSCSVEALVVLDTDGGPKLDPAALQRSEGGSVCFLDVLDAARGTSCTAEGCRTWVHDRVWADLEAAVIQPWVERSPVDAILRDGTLMLAEPGIGGSVISLDESWLVLPGEPVIGLDGVVQDGLLTAVARIDGPDGPEVVILVGPPESPEVIPVDTGGRVPVDVALHRGPEWVAVGLALAGAGPADDRLAWSIFSVE
jgi:hypothetical protein